MALSDILTSLHGRLLGLDSSGYLHSKQNEVHSASTASNIPAAGLTSLGSTASKAYTIDKPIPGLTKELVARNTTTATTVTAPSGVTFLSSGGSTHNTISMLTAGDVVHLQGLSTAVYAVMGVRGAPTFTLV